MTAIYARQSVDRADSISIEQQIAYCRFEARGDACKTYIDRGCSGKNMNRPRFAQMMSDIRKGEISAVIVYKLDRISRSIVDFANMMEEFAALRVQFISATEKFDTSTPMGKAMLNICIVFAQLERETIQKRVADAYFSRSQKGFYMGGPVPFGFRKVPAVVDGIHTAMYEAVPEEAEQIRLIYALYAEPDVSFGDVIHRLQELGLKKRGKDWERPRIRDILINPIYVRADLKVYNFFLGQGVKPANPPGEFIGVHGCYYYKAQNAGQRKTTVLAGNHLVLAPHTGIVESDLWLKCREKCLGSRQVRPVQKAKNSWLAGKIKCGECGYALLAKEFRNHKDRYLFCSHRLHAKACNGAGTLCTGDMEQLISGEIRKRLSRFETLFPEKQNAPDPELTGLLLERAQLDREISALLEKLQEADSVLLRYINEQVRVLDARKTGLGERIRLLQQKRDMPLSGLRNHLTMWEQLSFADKRRVTDLLIRVIYATEHRVTILWKI